MKWAELQQRTQDICAAYREALQFPKRAAHKRVLETFLKRLLSCLQNDDPQCEPTAESLERVQQSLKQGLFDRAGLRNVFRIYQPLPVHGTWLAMCCNATLDATQIAVLEEFKKRFRSNIDTQRFIAAWDNLLRARHKKRCESARLGDVDIDCALDFCATKGPTTRYRVEFLVACGFRHQQSLQNRLDLFLNARRKAFEWFRAHHLPKVRVHDTYMPLWRWFGQNQDIVTIMRSADNADVFCKAVEQAVTTQRQRSCLSWLRVLAKENSRDDIAELLQKPRSAVDVFRKQSAFHEELVQCVVAAVNNKQFVAFKKPHMRMVLSQFAMFLNHVERFAKTTYALNLQEFCARASFVQWRDAIRSSVAAHRVQNGRVKTTRHTHHALSATTRALHFVQKILRKHIGADLQTLCARMILCDVPNLRVPKACVRKTFTDAEYLSMRQCVQNPCEALCLDLLREVGLRNSALQHLRYDALLDDTHSPRRTCAVREKNNKLRCFLCSERLMSSIASCAQYLRSIYDDELLQKGYILHAENVASPCNTSWLGLLLKRVACAARVQGVQVHAHAFRHTLVTKLVSAGNSMEMVAKFMGHADARTTSYFYFTPEPQQLANSMVDPFCPEFEVRKMREHDSELLVRCANAKLSATRNILDALIKIADPQTLETLNAIVPHYKHTLDVVDTPIQITCDEIIPRAPKRKTVASDFESDSD